MIPSPAHRSLWSGLAALAVAWSAATASAQPPPVGPPPNQTEAGRLPVPLITQQVLDRAQAMVNETNTRLEQEGRSTRVSIESLTTWSPYRSATDRRNQPNSSFVRVPYILRIEVHIPWASNRYIGIPLDLDVSCDGWHLSGGGTVVVRSKAGPASIEGGNIFEDIIHVRDYIDNLVRASFNSPAPITMPLDFLPRCSTIGATNRGTAGLEDDEILWDVPPRPRPWDDIVLRPTVEVTFDRLTRLTARRLGGGILYQEVEDIYLNTFANYTPLQKALTMREGDDVALNLPAVRLDPRKFETLVVIGHVDQPAASERDSSFTVTPRTQNYAPGVYRMRIPKWYWMPPDQWNRKPRLVSVPAYELTYTVRYIDPGVVQP